MIFVAFEDRIYEAARVVYFHYLKQDYQQPRPGRPITAARSGNMIDLVMRVTVVSSALSPLKDPREGIDQLCQALAGVGFVNVNIDDGVKEKKEGTDYYYGLTVKIPAIVVNVEKLERLAQRARAEMSPRPNRRLLRLVS